MTIKGQPGRPRKPKEDRKQVGIHIDIQLWRKFRARCMEQGVQAGYKVEALIREHLGENKAKPMTRGKDRGKG